MSHRHRAAVVAASALLASAGLVVRAAEPTPADALSLAATTTPRYLADQTPSDASLMGIADKLGVGKGLNDYGIAIGGYVEASWTYNFRNVRTNEGRAFDFENQDPTLNQLVVYIDKPVDPKKNQFQIGGHAEMMWGADARSIHPNGIFDHYGVNDGPENQFDPTQFYLDFYIPVGNGLQIRAGKFVTLVGQETINPTGNLFYSHSYLFLYGPFTHLGAYATYGLNDALTIDVGFSRGWEQGFEDNNHDAIDVFGRVSWTINPKSKLLVTAIGGPERAGETGDYRYLLDVVYNTQLSDQLSLSVNADIGWEENGGINGDDATWYGVAGYLSYKVSDMISVNARGEWFEDPDGNRGVGTTGALWEATLGVDIHPLVSNKTFASLRVRPEIRYDYSNDGFFAGGTKHDQWTFGVDAIFGF
jgi:hypothetical protein